MQSVDFLLVGGGIAAAKCAEVLRKEGAGGKIMIVSADGYRPYHRPPLSKGILMGYEQENGVFFHDEKFYEQNGIDLLLNTRIVRIQPNSSTATDMDGNEYKFGKLLVATGSTPRIMTIEGSKLENIFYLRSLDQSLAIRSGIKSARSAAIVGAGFIGMEVASAFIQNNISTTMIVRENELFGKLRSREISAFFLRLYQQKGVEIWFEEEVQRFIGKEKVEKLVTKNGKELACDIVVAGIGVIPEDAFLHGSDIEITNGIVTDEYLQTDFDNIYAAGDVANFYDPIFGKQRRIEHWDNAIKQGELAAKNMLGNKVSYNIVSYFFSDIFDISFEFLGDNSNIDETLAQGSFEEESFALYYLRDKVVKAAFLLMRPASERENAEKLIIEKSVFP